MQKRDFYFLLPVGITLIAAVFIELVLSGHAPSLVPVPQPVFPGLADHLRDLAWVRVSRGAVKVDFANVAGRWVVVQKDNYPAAPAKLRGLLDGLAELTLIEPDAKRSADSDVDAASAGEPVLITLRGRTGSTLAEAVVAPAPAAAPAEVGNAVYVHQSGAERASLARGSVDLSGDLLGWLDRVHQVYTRTNDDRPQQAPWMRSMRGERGSTRKRGVLDTVMIVSVIAALVLFGLWFFVLAGSSLPGG